MSVISKNNLYSETKFIFILSEIVAYSIIFIFLINQLLFYDLVIGLDFVSLSGFLVFLIFSPLLFNKGINEGNLLSALSGYFLTVFSYLFFSASMINIYSQSIQNMIFLGLFILLIVLPIIGGFYSYYAIINTMKFNEYVEKGVLLTVLLSILSLIFEAIPLIIPVLMIVSTWFINWIIVVFNNLNRDDSIHMVSLILFIHLIAGFIEFEELSKFPSVSSFRDFVKEYN